MFDVGEALALMQYGDSAFPAGGFAFSWGLEGLAADGDVSPGGGVESVVVDQLKVDGASWIGRCSAPRGGRATWLRYAASISKPRRSRLSPRCAQDRDVRGGRSLALRRRAAGRSRGAYRAKFADARLGHLPVAQAIAYRDAGLSLASAEIVSGWSLVNGLVSAAARLGLIDHADAQDLLSRACVVLAASKLAKYAEQEQAMFEALAHLWPSPDRRNALRLVAMVGVGALRLGFERWADHNGVDPLADHLRGAFAQLKAEIEPIR